MNTAVPKSSERFHNNIKKSKQGGRKSPGIGGRIRRAGSAGGGGGGGETFPETNDGSREK